MDLMQEDVESRTDFSQRYLSGLERRARPNVALQLIVDINVCSKRSCVQDVRSSGGIPHDVTEQASRRLQYLIKQRRLRAVKELYTGAGQ